MSSADSVAVVALPSTDPAVLFTALVETVKLQLQVLPDKPEENARGTVRALWFAAAGTPRSIEYAQESELPLLSAAQLAQLRLLIEQRLTGVPLAYLTRRQRFMGLELLTGPEALIPRKETEILGTTALELLRTLVQERGQAAVIDLCTGSGNLAVALAHHEAKCKVFAVDLSPEAVSLARRNASLHHLEKRVEAHEADLFTPRSNVTFPHPVDLVVCNPPYISSGKVPLMVPEISRHEPRLAFDGGSFGMSILSRLIDEAPRHLKPSSWLCFEIGRGQGDYMARCLGKSNAYSTVRKIQDARGEVRALAAQTS